MVDSARKMRRLVLKRALTGHSGTWGMFGVDGVYPCCASLELPWKNNAVGESCIPPGVYGLLAIAHAKFGHCLALTGEEKIGRSGVLIHAGNTILETHGCILPGLEWGISAGHRAVLRSREALALLVDLVTGGDIKEIEILGIK